MILPLPLMATNLGAGVGAAALAISFGSWAGQGAIAQQQAAILAQQSLTTMQGFSATALIGVESALKGASIITASVKQKT